MATEASEIAGILQTYIAHLTEQRDKAVAEWNAKIAALRTARDVILEPFRRELIPLRYLEKPAPVEITTHASIPPHTASELNQPVQRGTPAEQASPKAAPKRQDCAGRAQEPKPTQETGTKHEKPISRSEIRGALDPESIGVSKAPNAIEAAVRQAVIDIIRDMPGIYREGVKDAIVGRLPQFERAELRHRAGLAMTRFVQQAAIVAVGESLYLYNESPAVAGVKPPTAPSLAGNGSPMPAMPRLEGPINAMKYEVGG